MGLDIKIPIGLMFSILGVILTLHGILTADDAELYARSLGHNINLWSGVFMILFGGFMLFTSRLFKRKKREEEEG